MRLLRNRGATAGTVVILLVLAGALLAPLLAPYDPARLPADLAA
ncbi:MAG: ABC transporter permease, partial [Candidatus Methylomirabilales bacterium]